jgi:PadR family transcriptional regulator, regulatory protein PadR
MAQTKPSLISGVPELLILRLLAARDMYGYELARAIRAQTAEAISLGEGVLYPALHALERKRLVRSRQREVNGRTRVYYALTPKGRAHLAQLTAHWRRIAAAVEAALAGAQRA